MGELFFLAMSRILAALIIPFIFVYSILVSIIDSVLDFVSVVIMGSEDEYFLSLYHSIFTENE